MTHFCGKIRMWLVWFQQIATCFQSHFLRVYCVFRFLSLHLFFVTMPRQVFSDDLEEKLIALWAEYQTKKSGIMMKRTKKEKEIADKLNLYAKEIGEDMEFSHSIIHNKIDNLKSKGERALQEIQEGDSHRERSGLYQRRGF